MCRKFGPTTNKEQCCTSHAAVSTRLFHYIAAAAAGAASIRARYLRPSVAPDSLYIVNHELYTQSNRTRLTRQYTDRYIYKLWPLLLYLYGSRIVLCCSSSCCCNTIRIEKATSSRAARRTAAHSSSSITYYIYRQPTGKYSNTALQKSIIIYRGNNLVITIQVYIYTGVSPLFIYRQQQPIT